MGLGKKGAATRRAILEAARRAFVRYGYDAGVREIAENAGVTAMLVKHYFGSKAALFEEVVDAVLSTPGILTIEVMTSRSERATFSRAVAMALVAKTRPEERQMDGFAILLRSTNNEEAMSILRRKIEAHFAQPLAKLLPGKDASQRAAILLAVIAGFQVMRQIVELPALTRGEPVDLAERLERLFRLLSADAVAV